MLNTFCILLRFIQLILYDTVNRNKVSIYINSLYFFIFYSLHVSAPTGHPQVRYISYFSVFERLF
jgi:hypothetical protein